MSKKNRESKNMTPKRSTPRHIAIKIEKIMDKNKILSSKGKATSYTERNSYKDLS